MILKKHQVSNTLKFQFSNKDAFKDDQQNLPVV